MPIAHGNVNKLLCPLQIAIADKNMDADIIEKVVEATIKHVSTEALKKILSSKYESLYLGLFFSICRKNVAWGFKILDRFDENPEFQLELLSF